MTYDATLYHPDDISEVGILSDSGFKFALDKLGPFCLQVTTNLSSVRWEFGLLNSMQYPVNDAVRFPIANKLMNN